VSGCHRILRGPAFGGKTARLAIACGEVPPKAAKAGKKQVMFFVYILENSKGKHYIGYTEDLGARLKKHNSNQVRSTKNKGPWKIVYNESYQNINEAYARERRIKKYKSGEAFRKLLMD